MRNNTPVLLSRKELDDLKITPYRYADDPLDPAVRGVPRSHAQPAVVRKILWAYTKLGLMLAAVVCALACLAWHLTQLVR